jgi:hypothetical protein
MFGNYAIAASIRKLFEDFLRRLRICHMNAIHLEYSYPDSELEVFTDTS